MSEDCLPGCEICHPPTYYCARCQNAIPRLGGEPRGNLAGGMAVNFHGWYGGTIDPGDDIEVLLCRTCANHLLYENKWLEEVNLTPEHDFIYDRN